MAARPALKQSRVAFWDSEVGGRYNWQIKRHDSMMAVPLSAEIGQTATLTSHDKHAAITFDHCDWPINCTRL